MNNMQNMNRVNNMIHINHADNMNKLIIMKDKYLKIINCVFLYILIFLSWEGSSSEAINYGKNKEQKKNKIFLAAARGLFKEQQFQ